MKLATDEVAIVAGGGRGIGRSIALALAARGIAVCLVARTRDELRAVTKRIRQDGRSACYVVADLTLPGQAEEVVEATRRNLGAPDVLVFSAAVPGPFGPLWLADSESWWAAMTLHVRAPALLLKLVLPQMIERRKGRIVLVSSRAGNGVHAFLSPYCVGKAAQTRLAAVTDCETREFGVRVFAIDPGLSYTQLARDTVGDPGAKRFLPQMVTRLSALSGSDADGPVLARCAARCVELVSGRYDALGGRFLSSEMDLDELLGDEGGLVAQTPE